MLETNQTLFAKYQALKSALVSSPNISHVGYCINSAMEFRRAGKPEWAVAVLEPLKALATGDASFNFVLALCYRDIQDLEQAYAAIKLASTLAPQHADIAFAKAQFAFESWRPSANLFRYASRLAPYNLAIIKNHALALAAEGRLGKAEMLLDETLETHTDWVEGHRQLSSLRVTDGQPNFDRSFKRACTKRTGNIQLRLGWFHLRSQAKDWDAASKILQLAHQTLGDQPALKTAEIYLRSESGQSVTSEELFGPHAPHNDPGFDLCRVRYLLRTGRVEHATKIAAIHTSGSSAKLFWPYLSLCWRLLEDERFEWLERDGALISEMDLKLSESEISDLQNLLNSLHSMSHPYLEQSVRGGTQTDRNLFFNPDRRIQSVRMKVSRAVLDYINTLPASDPTHPLLSAVPDNVRYSGAWSVRLQEQGFHAAHTHVLGWLSSAMYVAIPEAKNLGPPPSGYLCFGKPPPELGLDLSPYKHIKPKTGHLVLFPSFVWHGTEPFDAGERLTVAFDVMP